MFSSFGFPRARSTSSNLLIQEVSTPKKRQEKLLAFIKLFDKNEVPKESRRLFNAKTFYDIAQALEEKPNDEIKAKILGIVKMLQRANALSFVEVNHFDEPSPLEQFITSPQPEACETRLLDAIERIETILKTRPFREKHPLSIVKASLTSIGMEFLNIEIELDYLKKKKIDIDGVSIKYLEMREKVSGAVKHHFRKDVTEFSAMKNRASPGWQKAVFVISGDLGLVSYSRPTSFQQPASNINKDRLSANGGLYLRWGTIIEKEGAPEEYLKDLLGFYESAKDWEGYKELTSEHFIKAILGALAVKEGREPLRLMISDLYQRGLLSFEGRLPHSPEQDAFFVRGSRSGTLFQSQIEQSALEKILNDPSEVRKLFDETLKQLWEIAESFSEKLALGAEEANQSLPQLGVHLFSLDVFHAFLQTQGKEQLEGVEQASLDFVNYLTDIVDTHKDSLPMSTEETSKEVRRILALVPIHNETTDAPPPTPMVAMHGSLAKDSSE